MLLASPRPRSVLALLLLAVLAWVSLPAPSTHAADRTVAGGRLDWGIKTSFQTYVTGPIAQGSWNVSQGAATVGENQFRFHSAHGGYDPDTGDFEASYSGAVQFLGHSKDDGTFELDLTLSNPTVRISGGSGTLYADTRSKDRSTGAVSDVSQVPLAALDLSGVDLRGGTQISLSSVPATLTADGATAFAGYYEAGDALDPVNLTGDTEEPATEPAPSPSASEEDAEKDKGGDEKAGARPITDAVIDWGVRRTFREYVSGPVAEGEWSTTDGARDGGALFRFVSGEGTHDPVEGSTEAAFEGGVHFTGTHLDLLLSGVTVTVADGTGTLFADITTEGSTEKEQPLVTFEAEEVAEEGLFLVEEAPAELTEEGAAAFGGLYQPGTEMDPVTLAVALAEDVELPALPDLGSEPVAEPADEEEEKTTVVASEESSPSAFPLIAAGAGVLIVLATATYVILRRNRKAAQG